ncbi:FadR family transcriptional regulator [Jatrophihabitans cynanchi]|uniref:FadR family transcriptional regulator n=1 Tax=Jatrophihabitans cynanchi TaxID=2944128 RepID=A0ABY7K2Y9_9ACTN|nr:FadR family transcriptional regulator [Jatrophihabitans sp. SB3-54]
MQQGDKLPSEAELAELFGVSRATIREALRSIAASGLILTQPGATGGSFVRQIGPTELAEMIAASMRATLSLGTIDHDQISMVREILEIPAARLAATNRTEDDVTAIRNVLDSERVMTFEDPAVPPLDAKFHYLVARATHNDVLAALLGALHDLTQPVRLVRHSAESAREAVRQHRDILEGIAEGDPDRAERATRSHLAHLASVAQGAPSTRRPASARRAR